VQKENRFLKFTRVKQFRLSPRLNQDEIPELLTFVLRYGDETENIEDQKGEIFLPFPNQNCV
jgi:hypothetical protein